MSAPTLSPPGALPRARTHQEAPLPRPAPGSSRWRRAIAPLGLTLVLGAFAARALDVARASAITGDEATHLTHCLHYWQTGDDLRMWELGAPRLPHALYAWASYQALKPTGLLPADADPLEVERLVLSGARRVLLPARVIAVAWGAVLLAVTYWAVARTRGPAAGLIAATLLSLVPEVVAHSAIAGSDIPFTASAMLSLALLARYAERPSPGRWLAVGLAIGLAWAMRHSALLLLLLAAGVRAWVALRPAIRQGTSSLSRLHSAIRNPQSAIEAVAAIGGLGLVAAAVLWAGDGFETVTVAELSERATTLSIPERIGPIDVSRWPLPTSALSVLKQVRHQNKGHEAYFCGEYREQGWSQYFPVAFLLKTPVGFLILMVLAAALVASRMRIGFSPLPLGEVRGEGSRCSHRLRKDPHPSPLPGGEGTGTRHSVLAWESICLAALGVLWIMLVRNKVNIGVRYALLTYPLALPFVVRLFGRNSCRDLIRGPATFAAVVWLAWASLGCQPRPLSYFNEIGGGAKLGWLYLADSNIDWGQEFDTLAPTLARLGIAEVTTDISTERRLDVPGITAVRYPSRAMQVPAVTPPNRRLYDAEGEYLPVYTRYVAVSVSRLLGLYSQNDLSWLRTRRLVARIGDSLFLFDMDRPADVPFFE